MKHSKKLRSLLTVLIVIAVLAAVFVSVILIDRSQNRMSRELSVGEAQQIVEDAFAAIPKPTAIGANYALEHMQVTVDSVSQGSEKNAVLSCRYTASNIAAVIVAHKDEIMSRVYAAYVQNEANGVMTNATKICLMLSGYLDDYLKESAATSGNIELSVYEMTDGTMMLYLSDEAVDICTGGLITVEQEIRSITSVTADGQVVDITNKNTLRTGIVDCFALKNYNTEKPETGSSLQKSWNNFKSEFRRNFIDKAQWTYLSNGLLTTLEITGLAVLIGILIGFLVAIVRCTHQTTGKLMILDKICQIYLTIIRGTPVMVQLLIIYFVLLLPAGVDKFPAAVLCFGLNSGAYVAEIVRGGIMSVDKGQNEAGRSLGFNFPQTMIFIIIPQAFKAVLPAMANEFITLLKESSVAFYIGVADLTQGGLKIRSITYSNFMPLIAVALIYLVIVMILTKLVGLLEKRLRKSDH